MGEHPFPHVHSRYATAVQSALAPSGRPRSPPLSMQPLLDAAHRIGDQGVILLINSYANLIEKARFSRREPDEADANGRRAHRQCGDPHDGAQTAARECDPQTTLKPESYFVFAD